MKRRNFKIISLMLVIVMMFSMVSTVFAFDEVFDDIAATDEYSCDNGYAHNDTEIIITGPENEIMTIPQCQNGHDVRHMWDFNHRIIGIYYGVWDGCIVEDSAFSRYFTCWRATVGCSWNLTVNIYSTRIIQAHRMSNGKCLNNCGW
ncbi:MAG: hypothetical protein FWC41_02050 [Firmicutes bacterium]|nr:hypothetical protein [Bacillota bacterium]